MGPVSNALGFYLPTTVVSEEFHDCCLINPVTSLMNPILMRKFESQDITFTSIKYNNKSLKLKRFDHIERPEFVFVSQRQK